MYIGMFMKIFSECCVLLSIPGAFPLVFPYSYPLLLPGLVCALAAGLAAFLSEKGRAILSRLCAAIPLSALLFADSPGEMLILLPAIVYTAAVILRGRLHLEYYSYRQFFRRSLFLVGGLFLVLSAVSFIETSFAAAGMTVYGDGYIQAGVILRYGLVHLLCGIILQRQLRLGMDTRAVGGAGQMAAILGGTGVVLLAFVGAEPALRRGAAAVFNAIITALFGAAMAGVELVSTAVNQLDLGVMQEEVVQAAGDRLPARISNTLQNIVQQTLQNQEASPSLWWVVPVILVLILVMVLMFLSFRKKGAVASTEETVAAVDAPAKEKKQPRRSNRAKVRQVYREFLRQEKKRGLSLKKDYTSEDILQRISDDTDEKAAAQLRELYIRARYDETREMSRAQVDAAKAALKRSRGGTNAPV